MMPTKLLIACAGDTDVQGIADDLRGAGLPAAVHATVLSVADLLPIPATAERAPLPAAARRARERTASALQGAQRMADNAAQLLRAAFPAWVIDTDVQVDAPAWAIVKQADQRHADLIVLCAHDRSALYRVALGSVSQSVLAHAACSVRIVRAPRRDDPALPPALVVGIDGSAAAEAAAAAVAARTWPAGTTVLLLSVVDPTLANVLGFTDDADDEHEAAARLASGAAAALSAAGLVVSSVVLEGNPKEVLVEQADVAAATCLFVGARGVRAVERILLGSVSASVAARAHCSVEVVRR